MSIRSVNGEVQPLVGDGNIVPTPDPPPYKEAKYTGGTIIYDSCHGVKRHVPLCESSKTDLHRAVEAKDPGRLAELLAGPLKEQIDHQNWEGWTALHSACFTTTTGANYGRADPPVIDCALMLIEEGANLDVHGAHGYTPLIIATISKYPAVEITEALVAKGADLCAVDEYGGTALHNAAYGTHVETLKRLRKHPDWEKALAIVNKDGKTALDIAKEVYDKQEKKVELAPSHCELKMILETGEGFPPPDFEKMKADSEKAKAKAAKKAAK